jgi:molecular chaperone GrpE (heat shock protein)
MYREGQYKKAIAELVAKWVEAGSPQTGERGAAPASKSQPEAAQNKSTEAKISELCTLRDRGLITQEEFENLRKEALSKLVQ